MLTEFHGEPVAGGTLPALIWKAFMTKALARASRPPLVHPGARTSRAGATRVVFRDGALAARQRLLPGHPRRRVLRRARAAEHGRPCYANEVSVPLVVGALASSRPASALASRAARRRRDLRPRRAGNAARSGRASRSRGGGFLSATAPCGSVVTRRAATGCPEPRRLEPAGAPASAAGSSASSSSVRYGEGPSGTVLEQSRRAGVAVAAAA